MKLSIEAACGSHKGNVRKNHEDNFYFNGEYLDRENDGLQGVSTFSGKLKRGTCVAVFDGMGGEDYGEEASFVAAEFAHRANKNWLNWFVKEEKLLAKQTLANNDAVVEAKKKLETERMGTTVVMLRFTGKEVYVCNVGDSRAYRLRDGQLLQISVDHVVKRPGVRKTPLTQHLGIDPIYMTIEPYIACDEVQQGDSYLLCSDGLTDMLTDEEICAIMQQQKQADACVKTLTAAALERGGRDNVTIIVCNII